MTKKMKEMETAICSQRDELETQINDLEVKNRQLQRDSEAVPLLNQKIGNLQNEKEQTMSAHKNEIEEKVNMISSLKVQNTELMKKVESLDIYFEETDSECTLPLLDSDEIVCDSCQLSPGSSKKPFTFDTNDPKEKTELLVDKNEELQVHEDRIAVKPKPSKCSSNSVTTENALTPYQHQVQNLQMPEGRIAVEPQPSMGSSISVTTENTSTLPNQAVDVSKENHKQTKKNKRALVAIRSYNPSPMKRRSFIRSHGTSLRKQPKERL